MGPEFSYRLLATISLHQMLSVPLRFSIVLPFHKHPAVVNMAKRSHYLLDFEHFLRGTIIVDAAVPMYLHIFFGLESSWAKVTLEFISLTCRLGFVCSHFQLAALVYMFARKFLAGSRSYLLLLLLRPQ